VPAAGSVSRFPRSTAAPASACWSSPSRRRSCPRAARAAPARSCTCSRPGSAASPSPGTGRTSSATSCCRGSPEAPRRRRGAPDHHGPQHPQHAEPAEHRQDAGGPPRQRRLADAHRASGRLAVLAGPELHGAPGAGGLRRGDDAGVLAPARLGPARGSRGARRAGRAVRGDRGRSPVSTAETTLRCAASYSTRSTSAPCVPTPSTTDATTPGQAGTPGRVAALRRVAAGRFGLGHSP
jgi:hypothetical protein